MGGRGQAQLLEEVAGERLGAKGPYKLCHPQAARLRLSGPRGLMLLLCPLSASVSFLRSRREEGGFKRSNDSLCPCVSLWFLSHGRSWPLPESGGPFIDQVYVLQSYAEGWKEGTWEEKVDERPCIDPLLYAPDKHEYYRCGRGGGLGGRRERGPRSNSCGVLEARERGRLVAQT